MQEGKSSSPVRSPFVLYKLKNAIGCQKLLFLPLPWTALADKLRLYALVSTVLRVAEDLVELGLVSLLTLSHHRERIMPLCRVAGVPGKSLVLGAIVAGVPRTSATTWRPRPFDDVLVLLVEGLHLCLLC